MSDEEVTVSWDGGWEATRLAQLALVARATPAARLAWLEEAIRLAHAAGALPRRHGKEDAGPTPSERGRSYARRLPTGSGLPAEIDVSIDAGLRDSGSQ